MNYIIENNINFFDELKKELNNENLVNKEEICLITHQPLDTNYITLECNHKFNYLAIYNEVMNQKCYSNYLETTCLGINQIKCPYCRTITNKLLPYIEHPMVTYKKGVNYPFKYCMKLYSCEWIMKSGKHHAEICGKNAYKSSLGTFCCLHQRSARRQHDKINKINTSSIDWTEKHRELNKKYKVIELKQILRENKKKVGGTKLELIDRIIKKNLL